MVISNLQTLRAEKMTQEGRRITYKEIIQETGISSATLAKLLKVGKGVGRVDGNTLDTLCKYFNCDVGDILKRIPEVTK